MNEILKEILKENKLIKVLIKENDIDNLQLSLNKKNELIKQYHKEETSIENSKAIFEDINRLDVENIESFKILMNKTKVLIDEVKNQKGEVKNKNVKMRKYKSNNIKSGYRFDRKK